MPRYIDAEALYKDFENDLFCLKFGSALQGTPRSEIDISNVLERIENAPTEDVAPVKHGYWKPVYPDKACERMKRAMIYECSECGRCVNDEGYTHGIDYDFCPYCSATMDRKEEAQK